MFNNDTFEDKFAKARAYSVDCNYKQARRLLEQLLLSVPHNDLRGNVLHWLADCCYWMDDLDIALNHYLEAIEEVEIEEYDHEESRLGYLQVLVQIGTIYWKKDEIQSALKYLERGSQLVDAFTSPKWNEDRCHLWRTKGQVHERLRQFQEAVISYEHALAVPVDESNRLGNEVNLFLARVLYEVRRDAEAKESLLRIDIERFDKDYLLDYHHVWSSVACALGDYSSALRHHEEMSAIGIQDESKAEAHNLGGRIYYYLGKYGKAKLQFLESLKYPAFHPDTKEITESFLKKLRDK